MEKVYIIDENDTFLNAYGYFNFDHELEWWMWMLMNIHIFIFLRSCFANKWVFEVLTQVVDCIG
jgi:hypothetical protein